MDHCRIRHCFEWRHIKPAGLFIAEEIYGLQNSILVVSQGRYASDAPKIGGGKSFYGGRDTGEPPERGARFRYPLLNGKRIKLEGA